MNQIFISYSHKDRPYVQKLQKSLQNEGFDVWIDDRIDYGTTWPAVIQKNLDDCGAFIVVMSENSYESKWVQNEVTRAGRKKKPLFILLLSGDTWLSFEAIQYENVIGGKLPSEKFYENLARVVPRQKDRALSPDSSVAVESEESSANRKRDESKTERSASEISKPVKLKPARGLNLNMTTVFILIGLACMMIAALFISPLIKRWFSPPPVLTETATVTAALTSQSASPMLTLEPSPVSVAQMIDSKGAQMILVLAGEFTMGSNNGEPDEGPAHTLYLDSYYLDKYEVTNELYKTCVDAGICLPPVNSGSYSQTRYYGNVEFNNYPVVYVTWDMARSYCEWRDARLPTEAEWEKALRGEGGGVSIEGTRGNHVNFCDRNCPLNWADPNYDDGYPDAAPRDAYPEAVSPYGFYNLSGNVWEWMQDWYGAGYYQSSPEENPTGPGSGTYRVIRGGSYGDILDYTRVTRRSKFDPSNTTSTLGFRCARSVDTTAQSSTPEPGFSIVNPQEVLNIAPELQTLGQLAVEKYSTEERNRVNNTLTFTVNSTPDVPILWRWFWCAVNDKVLEQNMTKISLIFDADGYVIPETQLATVVFENADPTYKGWKCRTYETVLRDWRPGTYKLTQTMTISSAINDGDDTFEAGYKVYEYTVNISP